MSPLMITEIAGAAGYASGLVAEQMAIRHAAKNELRLTEAMELALANDNDRRVSLAQKTARTLFAPLAITVGVATALETYGNVPGEVVQHTPAILEVVVDHSAATALDLGGKPTVSTINMLASRLANKKIDSEALVAGSDEVKILKINQLAQDQPFGAAPLTQALTFGLNKAELAAKPTDGNASRRTSGVVFITNGNTVVGAPALATKAKQQQTPVYVVNVERSSLSNQTTNEALRQLATATNGKYWNATEANLKSITDDVTKSLRPNQSKHQQIPHRNLFRVMGGALLVSAAGQYVGRKNKTTGRGAKGE